MNKRQRIAKQAQRVAQLEQGEVYSSDLKQNATPSEIAFKEALEDKGIVFEFQKPLHTGTRFCIVDFYIPCQRKILGIELDGHYHFNKVQSKKDQERSVWLYRNHKIEIKRYPNSDVYNRLPNIIADIMICRPQIIRIPKFSGV